MEYLTDIMKPEDRERFRSIYLEGIVTGNSTFEADAPDWDKWDFAQLREQRLVVRVGDSIVAWAALSQRFHSLYLLITALGLSDEVLIASAES